MLDLNVNVKSMNYGWPQSSSMIDSVYLSWGECTMEFQTNHVMVNMLWCHLWVWTLRELPSPNSKFLVQGDWNKTLNRTHEFEFDCSEVFIQLFNQSLFARSHSNLCVVHSLVGTIQLFKKHSTEGWSISRVVDQLSIYHQAHTWMMINCSQFL